MEKIYRMSAFVLIVSAIVLIFGGMIFTARFFTPDQSITSADITADIAQGRANLRTNFFMLALTFLQFATIVLLYAVIKRLGGVPSDKAQVEGMEPRP